MSARPAPQSPPEAGGGSGYTSLCVFLLGAVALIMPFGYFVGPTLLLLGSAALPFMRPRLALGRREWAIMITLLVYAATSLLDSGWYDRPGAWLLEPGWSLLAIPALLLLLAYPPQAAFLWAGLASGGLATGVWSSWQSLIAGVMRAGGFINTIQFGDLSMLLGLLCLAGLGWAWTRPRRRAWLALLLLGAIGGILGSLLSGSRGGWVVMPFALGVLYYGYGRHISRRGLAGLAVGIVAAAVLVYSIPQTGVQERVQRAFSNFAVFLEQGDPRSSVGARLAMWHTALNLIPEKPLLGWDTPGYERVRERLIAEGEIHPLLARFEHMHNDVLDAWLKRGAVGLAALLALYLVPLRLFSRHLRDPDLPLRAFALAGVLLPLAYLGFGLSQAFLAYDNGVVMYVFLLVTLWAGMRERERTLAH